MPLNILHHKSWNVYNTENIERVRRDEAKAKEEERKKKEKAIQAEREFRLALLRQKNAINTDKKPTNGSNVSLDSHLNDNGHINLFYEEEQQLNAGKNEEREEEERKKKEKFESQFIYSLTGKDKEKPWYSLDKTIKSTNNINDKTEEKLKKLHKDKKRKEVEDPLELIKKNLAKDKELEQKIQESLPYYQRERKDINNVIDIKETFTNPTELLKEFSNKRKSKHDSSSGSSSDSSSESDSSTSSSSDSYKKRKRSKHRHHHSHHHKHHKHDKSSKKHSRKKRKKHEKSDKQDSKSSIEKLREERLKREQEERQRALHINGALQSQTPMLNKVEEDKYYYNSQFNPDSIRQLKRK